MKKTKCFLVLLTVLAVLASAAAFAACGGDDGTYTLVRSYDNDTRADIPTDLVNQVMFAYGENADVTLTTKLTLNDDGTYTLYKQILTPEVTDESTGETMVVMNVEYEFYGTYTRDDNDANSVLLDVPSSGRTKCIYPTVLNYQSVEKQTQDWVSSTDAPYMLTRFNKWYPAKNPSVVAQPVTLSGNTLTFGDVTFPSEEEPETPDDETPDGSDMPDADPDALISAQTNNYVMDLYTDGTYQFTFTTAGLTENGTWTWENYTLTVTRDDDETFTASFNADYNLELPFTAKANAMVSTTFLFSDWGSALGTSGTYTPAA